VTMAFYNKPSIQSEKAQYVLSISIIGALFFIFGFVTWLNGILIPYFKIACDLTNFQSLFVAFAFYISYTIMALPSSWVLKKTGFKRGMMVGLFVMAVGTITFIPAAITRTYGLFLAGLFIMGTGLALLQTASNPYITIVGKRETAARRFSIMGICNKLAGTIAPLILAYFILNDGDVFVANLKTLDPTARTIALNGLAHRVIIPYLIMTIVLVMLGLMVRFSLLPEVEAEKDDEVNGSKNGVKNIAAFPHLVLGVMTLFFYVGAEVIAGDTIIRYGISLGINISTAKVYTSYTLVAMVIGYSLGILLIPKIISQRIALVWSAILGLIFSLCVLLTSGKTSVFFVAILGFANAMVWPAIWPLAIHNLGKFIKTGSALLIMAIAGGAILPLLWGRLADFYSPHQAYVILIPCYIIIFLYAVWWCKLRNWHVNNKKLNS
jgi:MFS transporter, FHS family, L-fucose permease